MYTSKPALTCGVTTAIRYVISERFTLLLFISFYFRSLIGLSNPSRAPPTLRVLADTVVALSIRPRSASYATGTRFSANGYNMLIFPAALPRRGRAVRAPRFRPRPHCRRASPRPLALPAAHYYGDGGVGVGRRARVGGRELTRRTRSHRSPVSVPPPTVSSSPPPINCETTAFPPAHDTSVHRSTALV